MCSSHTIYVHIFCTMFKLARQSARMASSIGSRRFYYSQLASAQSQLPKREWLVIAPDQEGAIERRIKARPYVEWNYCVFYCSSLVLSACEMYNTWRLIVCFYRKHLEDVWPDVENGFIVFGGTCGCILSKQGV